MNNILLRLKSLALHTKRSEILSFTTSKENNADINEMMKSSGLKKSAVIHLIVSYGLEKIKEESNEQAERDK